MQILQVDSESAGLRLDAFLSEVFEDCSRARIQKAIEKGAVLVGGESAPKSRILKDGDAVSIDEQALELGDPSNILPQDLPLEIIYEDEYMVIVNKAAGMVVHPGSGNSDGTLVNAIVHRFASLSTGTAPGRPGIVHRLDKDTSGLIIVAKTDAAHTKLAALFAERKIVKQYVGICITRNLPIMEGSWLWPLGRKQGDALRFAAREDGKPAHTDFTLAAFHNGIAVLSFDLHTGRTHQIRVHAARAGMPIVQDELYGCTGKILDGLHESDRPFARRIMSCFTRQALHARRVSFVHPFTGKDMVIEAPFPADFVKAMGIIKAAVAAAAT